jgi:hypothetical protein
MRKRTNVAEQARKAGIPTSVVYARLNQGWKLKKALATAVQKRTPRKVKTTANKKSTVDFLKTKTTVDIPVQHYRSDRPSKLVWVGLAAVFIMLVVSMITR